MLKIKEGSELHKCPPLIGIFNHLNALVTEGKITESMVGNINIIDVGMEPENCQCQYGIGCLVTVDDIEGFAGSLSGVPLRKYDGFGISTLQKCQLQDGRYFTIVYTTLKSMAPIHE